MSESRNDGKMFFFLSGILGKTMGATVINILASCDKHPAIVARVLGHFAFLTNIWSQCRR